MTQGNGVQIVTLYVLLGYLAIITLHFYPIAFAHPLAASIDYDGYVNTGTQNHIDGALMKHVLGGIVETCQTITMQNHRDSTLMKLVPGDFIETHQAAEIVETTIILNIFMIISVSTLWIGEDNLVRANWM